MGQQEEGEGKRQKEGIQAKVFPHTIHNSTGNNPPAVTMGTITFRVKTHRRKQLEGVPDMDGMRTSQPGNSWVP